MVQIPHSDTTHLVRRAANTKKLKSARRFKKRSVAKVAKALKMASKRKRKKNKKSKKSKQKYIPIVVLNNQIPVEQNDSLDIRARPQRPQLRGQRPPRRRRPVAKNYFYFRENNAPTQDVLYYRDPRPPPRPQRPPRLQRRMGTYLDGSETSKSEDNYYSASNHGGCCGRGGGSDITGTEALIFLAALAFAVAFLNQQITMFLGGRGRRRKRRNVKMVEALGKYL